MISEFENPWRIFLSFQNRVYLFISLFYYYTNFRPYKSYPFNRNLVLEIYKEMVYNHVISKHMHKQNLSMMHNLLTTYGVNRPYNSSQHIIIPNTN
jgi:hypothetical protein